MVAGNTYIANVALADLLISGIVMVASAVVLLAGLEDCLPLCNVQWFLGLLCGLVTIFSIAAMALENYTRLCLPPEYYAKISTTFITSSIFIIWGVSTMLVSLLFILNLGPDFCHRKFKKHTLFQLLVPALIFVTPLLITAYLYTRTILKIRAARANPSFKPSLAFNWDYSLMLTNLYSFIMFVMFWTPFVLFLITSSVGKLSELSYKPFYWSIWFALSKSCFNNLLYCFSNRHFCDAYVKLFHYCCCKTTVTFSRRPRTEGARPSGDVRVHIIPGYNVYPYTSPQRSSTTIGEPVKKMIPASGKRGYRCAGQGRTRSKDRDVYQL